jgi:spermidine synthase
MSSFETSMAASPHAALSRMLRMAPSIFAATLFLSALLLFAVQPMFTKLILPKLGGAPSVWSVAMAAFQAFLFIGYVYAHLLARSLAPSRAAIVHLGFLAVVALTLPLGVAKGFGVPPTDGVMLWLVALFAVSIGLPFVALSATAPLLQSWFAALRHPQARNPYVLYAASNLGSFGALLAYPFVIEPFLTMREQLLLWSVGFSTLAILIAAAACTAARYRDERFWSAAVSAPTTASQRLAWMLLTAIPAGMVIAVTSYITTDLAAAPFLWVVPLALYLLTFVAVFRNRPWVSHALVLRLLPFVVAPLAVSVLGGSKVHWLAIIALNLAAFVMMALACHGEAYRRRPPPDRLTEFYLWTSFGGVIGGVFAGLIAPNMFSDIYEYPILIVAALIVLPGLFAGGAPGFLRGAAPGLMLAVAVVALRVFFDVHMPLDSGMALQVVLVVLAGAMLLQAKRPARFVGIAVAAFVVSGLWQPGLAPVERARSFFGIHQVMDTADGTHRLLFHGTTVHGAERVRDEGGAAVATRPVPLAYYYFGGSLSEAIEAARAARGRLTHVAAAGLGTGSLACHRRDGEQWTFFEIDPEVIRIARDPKYFRFLSECAGDARIVPGDARLTLAASPERYDLIVLDVFSSDAIPVHLLTREALAGYLSRLARDGVIAFHVSNRYMELASAVAAVAAAEGLVAFVKLDAGANHFMNDFRANAEVVTLARSVEHLGDLPSRRGWRRLTPTAEVAAWTDDYSDILRALLRKRVGN